MRRPASSSLLGTWLTTTVGPNRNVPHTWSAQDLGAVNAGFTNNLALGKLTIDVSTNNGRATFRSVSGNQALYVDYVELLNAVHSGDAFLTRLEAEWWTRFQGDSFVEG